MVAHMVTLRSLLVKARRPPTMSMFRLTLRNVWRITRVSHLDVHAASMNMKWKYRRQHDESLITMEARLNRWTPVDQEDQWLREAGYWVGPVPLSGLPML